MTSRTRVVAVGYASNAVGTINDVEEVVRLAHEAGAMAYIDAVHYAPHGPIDVRSLDCDFLVCSPYKFFGPHSGVLYGKRRHLCACALTRCGLRPKASPGAGRRERRTTKGWRGSPPPWSIWRNSGGATSRRRKDQRAALLAAYDAIRVYERKLLVQLVPALLEIPGLTFYGITEPARFHQRVPTVAVRIAGHSPRELAAYLGERGIFTWDGNYYALNLSERLGVEAERRDAPNRPRTLQYG